MKMRFVLHPPLKWKVVLITGPPFPGTDVELSGIFSHVTKPVTSDIGDHKFIKL